MAFGGPIAHVRLAESELEENLAASPAAGASRFGRAKLFQLALASAALAGCGTFAVYKARNGMAISKVQSKYRVGKQWRVYDENCITAPDLCPYGTKCMLKDDSWAACLHPGQCEPGKFVKIECEGPENQQVFGGETTYCKRWECCTLTEPRRPPFEEDVYSDKLPADYKPYLAVGPVAPPDRLSPHPWQPACEKSGCPPTTTGCLTSTTPGCPPAETTGDATSTVESVVTTAAVETTGKQTTTGAGTGAVTEGPTSSEGAVTTESATAGASAEGATTTAAATSPAAPATTTEAASTTEVSSTTETSSTTDAASTTGASSTTDAASTTEVSSTSEASSTTRIPTIPPPPPPR